MQAAWRFAAALLCFSVLFSMLVDATSHAAHAGHGHAPHEPAIMSDFAHGVDACEEAVSGCHSESDRQSGMDKDRLFDPVHCCLVFVWIPVPQLVAPEIPRLPLTLRNDAPRASITHHFKRPPKSLL